MPATASATRRQYNAVDSTAVQTLVQSIATDAVFVPRAIGRQHEVIGAECHLMPVDDGVGAPPFHDETQGGCGVSVRGCTLSWLHDLQAGVQPSDSRRDLLASWIVEIDDSAPRPSLV